MDKFIITITRGCGSGGRALGIRLAEEFGIPYYGSELLQLASDASGINEALFAQADEKVKSTFLKRKGNGLGEAAGPSDHDYLSEENLFRLQASVLRGLAERISFVVIGRAADYILNDFPNVVKVNVQAPTDYCISNVMKRSGLNEKDARKFVQQTNRERAGYYAYYSGQKWNDCANYDISLNTERLSQEECIKLIKATLEIKLGHKA